MTQNVGTTYKVGSLVTDHVVTVQQRWTPTTGWRWFTTCTACDETGRFWTEDAALTYAHDHVPSDEDVVADGRGGWVASDAHGPVTS
jgi:hypothetical protein